MIWLILVIKEWESKTKKLCCVIHMYHYGGVIMGAMVSQITSLMIVYSTV